MKSAFINNINFKNRVDQLLKESRNKEAFASVSPKQKSAFDVTAFLDNFSQTRDNDNQNSTIEIEVPGISEEQLSVLQDVISMAAVSGKFHPDDLFITPVAPLIKAFALNTLAPYCIIDTCDDKVEWTLNQEKRTRTLLDLIDKRALYKVLQEQLPDTDVFGKMLRQVLLNGQNISLFNKTEEELAALINVLETLAGIGISIPAMADVKEVFNNYSLFSDYGVLTSNFVGRETELQILNDFLNVAGTNYSWQGLLLTGMGGAGKSALIAKFTSTILSQRSASIAILDFDRPGLDPADTFWLEEEIARQIGKQYPELEKELSNLRKDIRYFREQENAGNSYHYADGASINRSGKELFYEIANKLRRIHAADKPLLIILDTLEEVSQKDQLNNLYYWLNAVAETAYPLSVKVILSGRLYGQSFEKSLNTIREIEVIEFPPLIAETFLVRHGLSEEMARQLALSGIFPLRPLELKLTAKILLDNKISVDQLQQDLHQEKGAKNVKELFAGIIYRRVLQRIDDPIVRAIAYPGLVLRYITTDIIIYVLKPVLKLPDMSKKQAEKVLEKLAAYTWLTHREDNGEIWHSKDLRRSMLQLMISKEPKRVAQIRKKAIKYFSSKNTEKDRAEVIYHMLLSTVLPEEGDIFGLDDLINAYPYISGNNRDLPKAANVLLQFAGSNKVDVVDIDLLPDKFFLLAYENMGRRLVGDGQLMQAYKLFKRASHLGYSQKNSSRNISDQWEKELLFSIGAWDELTGLQGFQGNEEPGQDILSLVNYIFPAALIDPAKINLNKFSSMLSQAIENSSLEKILPGSDARTIISRFAYSMTVINDQYGKFLRPWLRSDVSKTINDILKKYRILVVEKDINTLKYLFEGVPVTNYSLTTTSMKLNPAWLAQLKTVSPVEYAPLIDTIADEITANKTINSLLTALDASKDKRTLLTSLNVHLTGMDSRQILDMTYGPAPVFRDPCRYAIHEAFTDDDAFLKLSVIIRSLLPFGVRDCEPENFKQTMQVNKLEGLTPFIELLDRCWVLGEFLKAALQIFPDSPKLVAVSGAYEYWSNSYRELILSSGNNNLLSFPEVPVPVPV